LTASGIKLDILNPYFYYLTSSAPGTMAPLRYSGIYACIFSSSYLV